MDSTLSLLNLVCSGFTLLMVVVMLFTFRKPRPIGRLTPLLSMLLSLLLLALFWLLSVAYLNGWVAIVVFGLGLMLGLVIGLTTRMFPQGGRVLGKYSWLFLAGWGGSVVLAQMLTWSGWALAASLGIIPLLFSTGSIVGREATLFIRRWGMQAQTATS
jgi:hypothetical protein